MKYTKKTDVKMGKGKPSFKEKNDIFPVLEASTNKGSMDMSMFSKDALGSEIPTNGKYAKKGSGVADAMSGCSYIKENQIAPDASY